MNASSTKASHGASRSVPSGTSLIWVITWCLLGAHLIGAPFRNCGHSDGGASRDHRSIRSLMSLVGPRGELTLQSKAIEDIQVGELVLGRDVKTLQTVGIDDGDSFDEPESGYEQSLRRGILPPSEPSLDAEAVSSATWRRIELVMSQKSGGVLDIVLLRPMWWIEAKGAVPDKSITLSMPEMGATGAARVLSIGPCPSIRSGLDPVVTGTYVHNDARVLDVRLEGLPEPVAVTPSHPFYSLDRRSFVAAGDLKSGERLRSVSGAAHVVSVQPRPGQHRVYNLEVHGEHVYRVSRLGILVHNDSPGDVSLNLQYRNGEMLPPGEDAPFVFNPANRQILVGPNNSPHLPFANNTGLVDPHGSFVGGSILNHNPPQVINGGNYYAGIPNDLQQPAQGVIEQWLGQPVDWTNMPTPLPPSSSPMPGPPPIGGIDVDLNGP